MTFREIVSFRLVCAEPARSAAFYRAIGFDVGEPLPIPTSDLGLLGLSGSGARMAMILGRSHVELEFFDPPGLPYPDDATACDLAFQHFALVTDDAAVAWRRASDAGATSISWGGPSTLPPPAGAVTAIKFRDPDGHPLEFLQFPKDTHPSWKGKGVLGIDHSAISVGDVDVSRRFYVSQGLRDAGTTVNHGPAQDALDGLLDVNVDVSTLMTSDETPHVELLGYRRPIGRKSISFAPHDIAATRIVWRADANALIRDPDGHLHQLSSEGRSQTDIASP